MNPPLLSVIIVNYRSADLIGRLLESLGDTGLSREEYEIIISNNDPDEQVAVDSLAARHKLKALHHAENLGFGAGSNRAAAVAQGKYLLFCNPDTEFLSGDIREAIRFFERNSGIIGFRLVDADGRPERWSVGTDVSLWEIARNNLGLPPGKRLWESRRTIEAGRVSGAAFMMSKDLFDHLDGFDEDFFLYFEDADLCHRARQAGHAVLYHPTIAFNHQCGHSMPNHTEQKRHYYASQSRYFRKHRPKWENILLCWVRKIHR